MSEGFNHFKFMYQRFLTSTLGWSEAEQGAYMRLLIVQFDQGGIPADLDAIGEISAVAKKIWHKKLAKKFRHTNEDGTLYNAVMKGVRDDAIEKTTTNRANGSTGGRPKKNRTVIYEKPNGYENDNRKESETKPIPVTINQKPENTKKERVGWDQYPTAETLIELSDAEVQLAIEFVYQIKRVTLSKDRVLEFWCAFRINLSGDFYQTRGKLIQHFRNWLKDRELSEKEVKQESVAARSIIENKTNEILNQYDKR